MTSIQSRKLARALQKAEAIALTAIIIFAMLIVSTMDYEDTVLSKQPGYNVTRDSIVSFL